VKFDIFITYYIISSSKNSIFFIFIDLKDFIYDNPDVPDDIKRIPSIHLLNADNS